MINYYLYFFVAYLLVWAFLLGYMCVLSKKQKALRDEIQVLKNRIRVKE